MPVQNSSQSDVGFSFCQLLISYLVTVLLFITMSTLWSLAWKWHIFAWYSKCALLRLFVLFDVRAWLNISFVSRVKAICWKTIFYLLAELDTIPSSARTIKRAALTKRWSSLCASIGILIIGSLVIQHQTTDTTIYRFIAVCLRRSPPVKKKMPKISVVYGRWSLNLGYWWLPVPMFVQTVVMAGPLYIRDPTLTPVPSPALSLFGHYGNPRATATHRSAHSNISQNLQIGPTCLSWKLNDLKWPKMASSTLDIISQGFSSSPPLAFNTGQ